MDEQVVRRTTLPWLTAGLLLGLIQVVAVLVHGPLGVSTQFVVTDALLLKQVAPGYVAEHPLIGGESGAAKYQKIGYGWALDVGIVLGAALAAVATRRWRARTTTVWWQANGRSVGGRFVAGFVGGILILLGARFAHGCTSGQFASGWAQLSLSVVPFTVTLFGVAMLVARLVYPKVPEID
jgi:hypothetical protein